MSYVLGLKCKECGHRVPVSAVHVCEQCFGPYEVEYDYAKMKGKVTRESIAKGPKSLWRYRDLLPVETPKTGFHSGFTPLKKADRLAKELGCSQLYIKDDSCNYPTYSYKERVVSIAISKAIEFGFDTVGCASTGNLANSTAAHAAQAGIRCFVMIPHDLEQGKVLGSLIFGPTMVRIRGTYDDVNRLCTEIADKYGWAIVNVNLRPYYTEGAKTYGFEIAEQLGWQLPQHTIVPTAGGTTLPAAINLIAQGRIPKDDTIVVSITGNGLKTLEVVADELPYPVVIDPKLAEFDRLFEQSQQQQSADASAPAAREAAAAG